MSTGKVTRRLSSRRDAWKCHCVEAAEWINKDGGKTPAEIAEKADSDGRVGGYTAPLHPNCDCADLPVMKSAEEVRKDLFNKYFGEDALSKPVPKWEPPEGTLVNPEIEDFVVVKQPPKDDRTVWQRMKATRDLAVSKYPDEKWVARVDNIFLGDNIRAAESRAPVNKQQREFFQKELKQARMLADEGSTIYFLPEQGAKGERHPDTIIDGRITELKTVTGKLKKVWENFDDGRKKSREPIDVFLYIDSNDRQITQDSVLSLLSRKITEHNIIGGRIILQIGKEGKKLWINVDSLNKNTRS